MLSEPTRKVAVFQLAKLRNDASATPKQQSPEGRTGPAGNDPYCLTLLSEPTNSKALKDGLPNVAFWTYKKSSRLRAFQAQKRCLRHAQTAGPWRTDRACRQRPLLPNVAFWTYKKSSHLPAFQAQKRRLRWRTDRACRQRPLLPNVAFWTYKKSSHRRAFQAQKRRLRHAQTAGPGRTDRACRQQPLLPNVTFWTYKTSSPLRNGASATPKQQGPEGRTRPAGNGPYCLTLLSEPTRKVAVFQLSKLRSAASATPKQQGPEGRTGPAGNGPYCLTLLLNLQEK